MFQRFADGYDAFARRQRGLGGPMRFSARIAGTLLLPPETDHI
jgi:hypothetical protein